MGGDGGTVLGRSDALLPELDLGGNGGGGPDDCRRGGRGGGMLEVGD